MDQAYIEKFGMDPAHTYELINSELTKKNGREYSILTYEEYNDDGNYLNTFTVSDSSSTYPPFNRTVMLI